MKLGFTNEVYRFSSNSQISWLLDVDGKGGIINIYRKEETHHDASSD